MAFGVLYNYIGSPPKADPRKHAQRRRPGGLVAIGPANQYRNNPAPGSPHRILMVSDGGDVRSTEYMASPIDRVRDGIPELVSKDSFRVDETLLPAAAQAQLQRDGRAVVTLAEFEAAVWDVRPDFPMILASRGGVAGAKTRGN